MQLLLLLLLLLLLPSLPPLPARPQWAWRPRLAFVIPASPASV